MNFRAPRIRSSELRRKVTDLFLSQAFPLFSSMVSTFATAALLGVSGRGKLALIVSASSLVGAIGFLSLQVGVVRAFRDGDRTAPRRGFQIALVMAVGVLLGGIGIWFVDNSIQFGQFDAQSLLLVAVGGALVIVNLVVLRTRQGLGESRTFRNAWLIQAAVYPILGIPVAVVSREPVLVVFCWFIALIVSTGYVLLIARRVQGPLESEYRASTRQILGVSLAAHVGVMGQQLMHSADVVILGIMASSSAVGLYSVAVPIAGLIWVFSEALSLAAFDTGTRSVTAAESHTRRRQLLRLNFAFGLIGAIAVGTASYFLLPLVLPAFSAAVPLILILLPGVLIQGYARIGLSSILATSPKRWLITIGVMSILLSSLYIPFVGVLGLIGAAIGSSTIYALQTLVVYLIIRRLMHRSELLVKVDEPNHG